MRRWPLVYSALAGACDTLTGVLLVVAPATTLYLMGLTSIPAEAVWLRWIGAFVGAVGLTYLYPFALPAAGRRSRLAVVLEATALIRLVVATFVGVALLRGWLETGWISVLATDLVLALAQLAILRRGALDEAL